MSALGELSLYLGRVVNEFLNRVYLADTSDKLTRRVVLNSSSNVASSLLDAAPGLT